MQLVISRFADHSTAQLRLRTGQRRRELDRINQLVDRRLPAAIQHGRGKACLQVVVQHHPIGPLQRGLNGPSATAPDC
jgi:hypothetical protein